MADAETVRKERASALDLYAAAPSRAPSAPPPAPSGMTVFPPATGAVAVARERDVAKVRLRMQALAQAAGEAYYYRFPVKDRKSGRTSYVEGPSIRLANDLAREYGNCEVQTRVMDVGDAWIIYARFVDLETGFAMERPFRQAKGAGRIGGDDDARRLDMALQIGVSKAIRNVVVNALQTLADEVFDVARQSLVERIGKDIKRYREKVLERLGELGVDVHRVERVIGKAAKDWTAPDIAKIVTMVRAIADGMATVEETFPGAPAAEENGSDEKKKPAKASGKAPGKFDALAAKLGEIRMEAAVDKFMELHAQEIAALSDEERQKLDEFAEERKASLRGAQGDGGTSPSRATE